MRKILGFIVVLALCVAGIFYILTRTAPDPIVATAQPVQVKPETVTTAQAAQSTQGRVDIVRMDQRGDITVAGQAQPNVTLTITLDGKPIGDVVTDSSGFFASQLSFSSDTDHAALGIVDAATNSSITDQQFLLTAPTQNSDQKPTQTAAAVTEPVKEATPSIISVTAEGDVNVVQPSIPLASSEISLEAVSYDAQGDLVITGASGGEARAFVYLDGQFITEHSIEKAGSWSATLPEIDTGTYTMRLDTVDDAGQVLSRIETPLAKEAPETLAKIAQDAKTITVQPGFTLWRIASDRYGSGVDFVKVFDANRAKIKDPNLIYPGQVFNLPE